MLRETPRRSHQSQGMIERYHLTLQAQVQAFKTELEEKLNIKLALTNEVLTWLIRHAAWALARFQPYLGGPAPFTNEGQPL